MKLNYVELIQSYADSLHQTLRNFKPGPDFLDIWVPDEDASKSIFGIFESAEDSNEETLSLSVRAETAAQLDWEWIKKMTQPMGTLLVEEKAGETTLTLKFKKGAGLQIHPLYEKALKQYGMRITHEGVLANPAAHQTLVA